MNAELEHLIVLQAQDLDLARLRGELAEAPKRVKACEVAVAAAEASLNGLRTKLAVEDKLRRGQESEIASHRTKLDRLRRSLDTAANAQQVAAFEHEIHFAEAAIRTLEDAEFSSLERTEMLEAEEIASKTALQRKRALLADEQERAASLKSHHEGTISGLERERVALRKDIDERRLATYDKLTRTRGTSVAEALGNALAGKCAACQMGVRPQRWQDLIGRDHQDEIFTCESCGRLLFWDPRCDAPGAWDAGERLRSAQNAAQAAVKAGGSR